MKLCQKLFALAAVAIVLLAWVLWAMFLLAPSLEVNQLSLPAQNNPFGTAGSFGDAFGPIESLMATIAASGALYAFVNDRHDRKVQQFESNFFALLANFESITAQAKLTFGKNKGDVSFKSKYRALEKAVNHSPKRVFQGRSALRVLVLRIREGVNPSGFNDIKVVSNVYQGLFTITLICLVTIFGPYIIYSDS